MAKLVYTEGPLEDGSLTAVLDELVQAFVAKDPLKRDEIYQRQHDGKRFDSILKQALTFDKNHCRKVAEAEGQRQEELEQFESKVEPPDMEALDRRLEAGCWLETGMDEDKVAEVILFAEQVYGEVVDLKEDAEAGTWGVAFASDDMQAWLFFRRGEDGYWRLESKGSMIWLRVRFSCDECAVNGVGDLGYNYESRHSAGCTGTMKVWPAGEEAP